MSVESLPWDEFMARFRWRQGEHVSLIGPTGSGKTTLALALLPLRTYVCVFGTKPKDDTLTTLIRREGYKRIKRWPPGATRRRVVLWPSVPRMEDIAIQRPVFAEAMAEIYHEGGWTAVFDEVWYTSAFLGLARPHTVLWTQARALNVTVVASTQRPANVPLQMYSEPTHVFLWQMTELTDRKRIAQFGGSLNSKLIIETLAELERFEVLYLNTRTRAMIRTRAPRR
jgi:hypothetical protein